MRIFSNFDTKLRQKTFEEYQQHHGVDNVICFWRSQLYKYYKVIIPLVGLILFTLLVFVFFYQWLDGTYFGYIVTAIIIVDIVFLFPIIGKYVDYTMDFIIVIPNSIMMYDQWGILKRNIRTISADSIKSISIKKSWLLYSIFDNGDIIVLTEGDMEPIDDDDQWDVENYGEIKFRRIPKPEKRKNQILKIVGIDVDANQEPNAR